VVLSCVAIAAASMAIRRDARLPGWLGWLGIAVIPLAVVEAVLLLPVFMVPIWVLATSLGLATPVAPATRAV